MKSIKFILLFACVIVLGSCNTQPPVQRISPDSQTDLSGRWNDTDSRLVSEEMIQQMLGDRWLGEFEKENSRRPVVIVGLVQNKSHEHISAETFIKDLERSIIRNGNVRFVQAGDKRNELRNERADQSDYASPATAKRWGQELGADLMLQGDINSIVDSNKKQQAVYYQINLELTNLETNEIVWVGEKKIKKLITK